jgi:hypothetical protein
LNISWSLPVIHSEEETYYGKPKTDILET